MANPDQLANHDELNHESTFQTAGTHCDLLCYVNVTNKFALKAPLSAYCHPLICMQPILDARSQSQNAQVSTYTGKEAL